jgi:thiol-disulfide isomerase/thioredoxin
MKRWWIFLTVLTLAGCSAINQDRSNANQGDEPDPTAAPVLRDYGLAPELENDVWLNTDHPLRLKDLRGKVVAIEMWTFDCVNCQHVIPALKEWYDKYAGKGLVIIGNHYPEFSFEASLDNLKEAVKKDGILYPIAQDNDGKTFNAFRSQYWPTLYLVDKDGHIRYLHIGEGGYQETEQAIQELLAEESGSGSQ